MKKEDYLALPYSKVVQERNDETGHYFYGSILELDGCQTTAETIEELWDNLSEVFEMYIETKLERNLPIPLPRTEQEYSGKFVVRVPKSLHRKLVLEAESEGISLNQLVSYKLTNN